jgi:hypothetical protein
MVKIFIFYNVANLSEWLLFKMSNLSVISWQEQLTSYIMTRTTYQLYHDKNNLSAISWQEQLISYIMTRTTYQLYHDKNNLSAISW